MKRRKAWNGGCCSAAQIRDYCFREDTLIERVMWIAHREEMNRIQRRMDPKNHVKVASDDVAAPAVVDEAPPV